MSARLQRRAPPRGRTLEDIVYDHLGELVDFPALFQLEQIVVAQLVHAGELHAEAAAVIATHLIESGWQRLLRDPRRYLDGRVVWRPDASCALCRAMRARNGRN